MTNTILPVHHFTGLTALGFRQDGRPIWPVRGGSEDHDAAADQGDDEGTDEDADQDDDAQGDDDKDWKAEFEAQQKINRSLERKTKRDLKRIQELQKSTTGSKKDADDKDAPDAEAIKAQAKAEAAAELLHGRVEDKIEAKARDFADPEDAVAVLLRSHNIDEFIDDGKIDVEAITDALKELGEKKPHLLAQGKRFKGSADGGARPPKPTRPKSLGEALTRHYSSGK